jgi:hypothetical protein
MILVIAHEYIHLDGDLDSHKHDSAFYETFHDTMQFVNDTVYDVAYRTSQRVTNKLIKNGLKIKAPLKKRYGSIVGKQTVFNSITGARNASV